MSTSSAGSRFGYALLRVGCFAALGGLLGRHLDGAPQTLASAALAAVLVGEIGVALLGASLSLTNAGPRAEHGSAAIRQAVARGFVMLLPFACLALVAELLFAWDAVQAFTAAALTTAAAAAASEVSSLGGRPLPNLIIAMLAALALTALAVWLAAQAAVGVAP